LRIDHLLQVRRCREVHRERLLEVLVEDGQPQPGVVVHLAGRELVPLREQPEQR
jgi:hypothetical protein